jgi:23S rRNA pseudouridine1911/1915/1917 synthase
MADDGGAPGEEIPAALDGERLDRVIALLTGASRSVATSAVESGGVRVDGVVATSGKVRLKAGQRVEVTSIELPSQVVPEPDPAVPVTVVYEDADVIVVDKAPGVVVHPAPGNPDGTLVNGLLARFPELAGIGETHRPGIVHRLDAGTSGLLAVARTPAAHAALVGALAKRQVTREYLALVWGHLANAAGVIDAPIGRDPRDPMRMGVVVDGRPARTRYEVEQQYADPAVSLVRCWLETGRTHQIRVHLAAIGHPVVGDTLYGSAREVLRAPRPFLHATHLGFTQPSTGERLEFDAPLPDDLAELLASLTPA